MSRKKNCFFEGEMIILGPPWNFVFFHIWVKLKSFRFLKENPGKVKQNLKIFGFTSFCVNNGVIFLSIFFSFSDN